MVALEKYSAHGNHIMGASSNHLFRSHVQIFFTN